MRIKSLLSIFLVLSFVLVSIPQAEAENRMIIVPDDYASITYAVGNATSGDIIFIRNGTYNEHTIVIDKPLTIIGEDVNATILNNIDVPEWQAGFPFPKRTVTLEVISNEIIICNLTLSSNSEDSNGISGKCDWATILGNVITTGYECISLEGSNHFIMNNNIPNASHGMLVSGSYNIIMNNSVTRDRGRIVLGRLPEVTADRAGIGDCHFNLVYGNFISSSGIYLSGSNSMIVENDVRYISIDGSHNFVCINRITDGGTGLYIGWGINNTVCGNFVSNNNVGAFVAGGTSSVIENGNGTWITNNTIYHNNFIDNKYQTSAGNPEYGIDYKYEMVTGYSGYPLNYYDDGTEGNYWSNYNGRDLNKDGIGDIPYDIDFSGNKDPHPLMKPFNLSSIEIELPEWTQERISIKFIPEFPSWIILPLFLIVTLFGVVFRKKFRVA